MHTILLWQPPPDVDNSNKRRHEVEDLGTDCEAKGKNSECILLYRHTVEPPSKSHFGDNINSAGLSIIERCPLLGGAQCM